MDDVEVAVRSAKILKVSPGVPLSHETAFADRFDGIDEVMRLLVEEVQPTCLGTVAEVSYAIWWMEWDTSAGPTFTEVEASDREIIVRSEGSTAGRAVTMAITDRLIVSDG